MGRTKTYKNYFGATQEQMELWLSKVTTDKNIDKPPTWDALAELWNIVNPNDKTTGNAMKVAVHRFKKRLDETGG